MSAIRGRRRYRAPAGDRSWLLALSDEVAPVEFRRGRDQRSKIIRALQSASEAELRSREEGRQHSFAGLDRSLADLRLEAREEFLQLGLDSTSAFKSSTLPSNSLNPDAPIIMTGHQPSLVHPGVWAKNFATNRLARMTSGRSINLIVDSDMLGDRGIRLPERDSAGTRFVRFDYDSAAPAAPYVDAQIADARAFESFGARVSQHMQSQWGITPLIQSNWSDAVPLRSDEALSNQFTRMRHSQELRWGIENIEVCLSQLVDTIAFSRFFLDVVRRAGQFLDIHNRAVVEYRRNHRLRSESHPVPLLVRDGDRIELPFWSWKRGEFQRQPLYVVGRDKEGSVEIFESHRPVAVIPNQPTDDDFEMVRQQFVFEGLRIAPRALTTTLFCRVWLADLFIHGIGGAVYDQMTDRLIQEFYRIDPPSFLVLTGTLRLPIQDVPDIEENDIRRQQRLLRELEHQPERHLPDPPDSLLAEKTRLIAEEHGRKSCIIPHGERRALRSANHDRWVRLREINREMASHLKGRWDDEKLRLSKLRASLQEKRVLQSREYSAWLYPEELLRDFFGAMID